VIEARNFKSLSARAMPRKQDLIEAVYVADKSRKFISIDRWPFKLKLEVWNTRFARFGVPNVGKKNFSVGMGFISQLGVGSQMWRIRQFRHHRNQ